MSKNKITAVLGPTNTGKTYLAIETMLSFDSGMIGFPLRLLAREVYDKIIKKISLDKVALITGEEKIIPANAKYFLCTVESMPVNKHLDFVGIDEIQMCADHERGHIFTDRLLNLRGEKLTMFMGSSTIKNIINKLDEDTEFINRERLSKLSYVGHKKISRINRKTAIIAFSTEEVYAIAELVRRQKGGAAIVMGSLSPKTRNAQVELYQSGDVDFLVATDAIGMGINMDLENVYFSNLKKFDGKKQRRLNMSEIGQIAGRAGRYLNDGNFGITGDCKEIAAEEVELLEGHKFEEITSKKTKVIKKTKIKIKKNLKTISVKTAPQNIEIKTDNLRISKSNEIKPEIIKVKKQETEKKEYKVKDYVVYPKHGVGQITEFKKINIGGIDVETYVLKFEKDKANGMVPVNKQSHLRPLATINQVNKCISILKSKPKVKRSMWSRRAQEYEAKISSGKIYELAEVVRDLNKGDDLMVDQSYSERQLFEKAYERILSEFQIVMGVSLEDTQKKLDKALKRNLEGQAKAAVAAPTKAVEPDEPEADPITDTED